MAIRYTGNEILPFTWERINSNYGIESTHSLVQFDNSILGIGNYAIQVCDGNTSQRIDLQIPDEVFKFHNGNQGSYAKQLGRANWDDSSTA